MEDNLNFRLGYGSFIKYWLPVLIYAILIFYLSSIPGEDIPVVFRYQDVFLHLTEYALFALLFSRAIKASYPQLSSNKHFAAVFIFSFFYAVSDEIHQSFVPQRYCSLLDLAYDSAGIILAGIIWRKRA